MLSLRRSLTRVCPNTHFSTAVSNYRIAFFGSDQFSVTVVNHLLKLCPELKGPNLLNICLPEIRTKHLPNNLRNYSNTHSIPVETYDDYLSERIKNQFHLGIVASFGKLISSDVIECFKYGIINIHPSLLPKYRGSTPLQRTY